MLVGKGDQIQSSKSGGRERVTRVAGMAATYVIGNINTK